ncbi:MAG: winged helix-turn-helix domain-containing protein, partial [Halobaculum sp.]
MSRTSHDTDGTLVGTVLSVADLLEEPRLARIYDYLSQEGPATVGELRDALSLSQTTAYADVDRLLEANVIEHDSTDQPRTFTAIDFELTVTDPDTDRTYTIT